MREWSSEEGRITYNAHDPFRVMPIAGNWAREERRSYACGRLFVLFRIDRIIPVKRGPKHGFTHIDIHHISNSRNHML